MTATTTLPNIDIRDTSSREPKFAASSRFLLPVILTVVALTMSPASPAAHPDGFVETVISRPDGQPWNEAVGLTFSASGRMFVWERSGRIWIVDDANPVATPLIDISEEVGAWSDHGMLGLALHPDFDNTGFLYLYYVVDRHHLVNCSEPASGSGAPICGPVYNPTTNQYSQATIGRLTRYRARRPAGQSDYKLARSVDLASRKVLIGETISTGVPVLQVSHGVGTVLFGSDGMLLLSSGDGARPVRDTGGSTSYAPQGLADGIIRFNEDVGAYRSQLVDSLSGKILRVDPNTGAGVPSNPYFDPAAPRAPRSRVWALGLRNPFRMSVMPGTGNSNPSAGSPGRIFVGDVGWRSWESLDVVDSPRQNFGWPVYEGLTPTLDYDNGTTQNRDAPNPLFGSNGCTQQFFRFTDLIKQETQNLPLSFRNPCDMNVSIPGSVPVFMHRRPKLDWGRVGPARAGIFTSGNAATININNAGSPIQGTSFSGSTAVGGAWYRHNAFPAEFRDTYFFADYVGQWIRNLRFDGAGNPVEIVEFSSNAGGVVHLATNPVTGGLYYIAWTAIVTRLDYLPNVNAPPTAVATANRSSGFSPLTVQFDGSKSSDSDGTIASYRWDFGDGSAASTLRRPLHTFTTATPAPTSFLVTLTVTDDDGDTAQSTLQVVLNNTPPEVEILSPINGSNYPLLGEGITYELNARISGLGQAPSDFSCSWDVALHHNTHTHVDPPVPSCQGSFVLGPIGCDGDSYFYRAALTVTDVTGLSGTAEVDIFPFCGSGNMSPVANGDLASVNLAGIAVIPLLANDVDDNGLDAATVEIVTYPLSGSISSIDVANGNVTFDAAGSTADFERFSYLVRDLSGAPSNVANVLVNIRDAVNEPPAFDPLGDRTTVEEAPLSFTVFASDADGPAPVLTADFSNLHPGAGFVDNGDGSGTFNWVPVIGDAVDSPYTAYFIATDAIDSGISTVIAQTITVNPAVTVDLAAPVINILGSNPVDVAQFDSYIDAGATATDDKDGDLTAQITTDNLVNTFVPGTYIVAYLVSDSAGNAAYETRTVNVVPAPAQCDDHLDNDDDGLIDLLDPGCSGPADDDEANPAVPPPPPSPGGGNGAGAGSGGGGGSGGLLTLAALLVAIVFRLRRVQVPAHATTSV